MDYGIGIPSRPDAWQEVKLAEEAGFTHAWFYDSQLIWSDVWATMALAAQNTTKIKLGTLVAIPSNRIAPVTAAAAATINKLAPGRVILGIGTGYTGRNTMGLPRLTIQQFRDYALQVKGLLSGEDVLFKEGNKERWIRLIHTKENSGRNEFFNIEDPIPIMLAADGPRGQKVVGDISNGWILSGGGSSDTSGVGKGLPRVVNSAEASGNTFDLYGGSGHKPYVTALTSCCVLRPGETIESERVMRNIGPTLTSPVHGMWEHHYGPGASRGDSDPDVAEAYDKYINNYAMNKGHNQTDRLYLDVHEGHYTYLKDGEDQFVPGEIISKTLTGTGDQINERIDMLEDAGINNLALSSVDKRSALELITDFSEQVIQKR